LGPETGPSRRAVRDRSAAGKKVHRSDKQSRRQSAVDIGGAEAAVFGADRVGAAPARADPPKATKFTTIVNLKTAKALGVAIPLLLLGGADEGIE
jgi:hypothetical protein